ncbi:MAG: hypothetical protein WAM11_07850 [Cyanobium sp.]
MFSHHVFISYAHIDNLPLSAEQEGWISRFHQTFSVFLSQRLGGRARIWRDQKLQGNDIFGDEIVDAFRDAILLVSVFSPRYLRSEWCRREVSEFCAHAEAKTGLVIDNKARVFKIVKTPVQLSRSDSALPAVVRDSLGYDFYVQDDQGPIELDPNFGETFKQDYLRKVCIVANNAARLIEEIEARHEAASPVAAPPPPGAAAHPVASSKRASTSAPNRPAQAERQLPEAAAQRQPDPGQKHGDRGGDSGPEQPKPGDKRGRARRAPAAPARRTVVFLAAASFDQRDQRELIEADLRSHGYRVLPEERLPTEDEAEHRSAVLPLLEQAQCCVHLLGSSYGAVPDGPSQQSLVELHNGLAAERSRQQPLKRLIWLPAGLRSEQPNQQRFLDDLRQKAELQAGADLLDGSLEDLRTLLHSTLDGLENPRPQITAPPPSPTPAAPTTAMVYLICVQQDRKPSLPLRKWLKGEGLEVSLPAFDGDAAAVREAHEALLRDCSAALIFYGAGDEAWYRSVKVDLRRAPVYRDGLPLPPPITLLAGPDHDDKQDMVDMEEANLIDGRGDFNAELLRPLLRQLIPDGALP